ncbi:ferredoxin-fold anticodon-binding domain-containing protein 1 [Trichosurus vulpecula]|uniref:ferredoxin-fold anticodon-binding domain-containing protein 1 n=1 Tax=Trichosurus vulpecula TaxID=9337 RepID=UPI00186B282B|nr:ferredoxin-fold anticodon-binding domain-containing protein 1 [Trichosurus vulpecula]
MLARRLLLVGEGNFSFAAALSEVQGPGTSLIATCPQESTALAEDSVFQENLRRLRERGAEVRFGVDCTQLADTFAADGWKFDRIYFNFPHCGRKAGVAKNRELLARFFQSCADVLAERGEVHVALCRGQGGTPADCPRREWHNSWQVVAMAAGGGLILSSVHPFSFDAMPGYKCTGYRSQNKSFHVEGALNHVFTRSLPFEESHSMICRVRLDDHWLSFCVPEALVGKINRDFLETNSSHPVRTINEKLIAELSKTFSLQRLKCPALLLPEKGCDSHIAWSSDSPSVPFWIVPQKEKITHSELFAGEIAYDMEDFLVSFSRLHLQKDPERNGEQETQKRIQSPTKFLLRPSLLIYAQDVIQGPYFLPGSLHILSGPVFRKCLISPFMLPAFHETLFIHGFNKKMSDSCLQLFLEHLKGSLCALLTQRLPDGPELSSSLTFKPQKNKKDYMVCVKPPSFGPDEIMGVVIGSIITSATSQLYKDLDFVFASVNLDLLVMLVWGIPDWRILWTFDERFLDHFVPGKVEPFKTFSLYPPSYVHDVSFWLDEERGFDETEFHTVARAVSQDMITSIQLLNHFQHPQTGRVSLCYRLTYQACDRALSHQQAILIQNRLRIEIQKSLRVTVR